MGTSMFVTRKSWQYLCTIFSCYIFLHNISCLLIGSLMFNLTAQLRLYTCTVFFEKIAPWIIIIQYYKNASCLNH